MPAIIDHDAVKMNILAAFQSCIEERTITQIPLRMVAERAGMSHSKLLYYFKSKHELLVSYVRYTREYMTEKCVAWFAEHPRADYGSNLDYMNAFMEYVAVGKPGEVRPNATTQTYVLGHYNDEIGRMICDEFREWREVMERCLVSIYGEEVGKSEAEAMMILIAGTFICNYNRALTGRINDNIIGSIAGLARS